MPALYIDNSALAKWYLSEPRFEDFQKYIQAEQENIAISRLTVVDSGASSDGAGGQGT